MVAFKHLGFFLNFGVLDVKLFLVGEFHFVSGVFKVSASIVFFEYFFDVFEMRGSELPFVGHDSASMNKIAHVLLHEGLIKGSQFDIFILHSI